MRKVVKRPQCQVEMTPVIRPGRWEAKITIAVKTVGVAGDEKIINKLLVSSVNRQARKRRMNRGERNPPLSPPSASTLHTPTSNIRRKIMTDLLIYFVRVSP